MRGRLRGRLHGSQATPSRRLLAASVTLGLLAAATPEVVRAAEPPRGAPLGRPVAETFGSIRCSARPRRA